MARSKAPSLKNSRTVGGTGPRVGMLNGKASGIANSFGSGFRSGFGGGVKDAVKEKGGKLISRGVDWVLEQIGGALFPEVPDPVRRTRLPAPASLSRFHIKDINNGRLRMKRTVATRDSHVLRMRDPVGRPAHGGTQMFPAAPPPGVSPYQPYGPSTGYATQPRATQ